MYTMRVQDHEGRRVRLGFDAGVIPRALRGSCSRGRYTTAIPIVVVGLPLALVGGLVLMQITEAQRVISTEAAFIMSVAINVAVIGLVLYLAIGQTRIRTCILMQRIGLCPSCGYDLLGLAPERGVTCRCPECGRLWAVWRNAGETRAQVDEQSRRSSGRAAQSLGPFRVTRDARGRAVGILRPDEPGVPLAIVPEPDRARIALAINRVDRGLRLAAWIIGTVAIGLWIFQTIRTHDPQAPRATIVLASSAVVIGGLVTYALWKSPIIARSRSITRAMLEHGRCPSCVRAIPSAGEGGLSTCDFCGATWGHARGENAPRPGPPSEEQAPKDG